MERSVASHSGHLSDPESELLAAHDTEIRSPMVSNSDSDPLLPFLGARGYEFRVMLSSGSSSSRSQSEVLPHQISTQSNFRLRLLLRIFHPSNWAKRSVLPSEALQLVSAPCLNSFLSDAGLQIATATTDSDFFTTNARREILKQLFFYSEMSEGMAPASSSVDAGPQKLTRRSWVGPVSLLSDDALHRIALQLAVSPLAIPTMQKLVQNTIRKFVRPTMSRNQGFSRLSPEKVERRLRQLETLAQFATSNSIHVSEVPENRGLSFGKRSTGSASSSSRMSQLMLANLLLDGSESTPLVDETGSKAKARNGGDTITTASSVAGMDEAKGGGDTTASSVAGMDEVKGVDSPSRTVTEYRPVSTVSPPLLFSISGMQTALEVAFFILRFQELPLKLRRTGRMDIYASESTVVQPRVAMLSRILEVDEAQSGNDSTDSATKRMSKIQVPFWREAFERAEALDASVSWYALESSSGRVRDQHGSGLEVVKVARSGPSQAPGTRSGSGLASSLTHKELLFRILEMVDQFGQTVRSVDFLATERDVRDVTISEWNGLVLPLQRLLAPELFSHSTGSGIKFIAPSSGDAAGTARLVSILDTVYRDFILSRYRGDGVNADESSEGIWRYRGLTEFSDDEDLGKGGVNSDTDTMGGNSITSPDLDSPSEGGISIRFRDQNEFFQFLEGIDSFRDRNSRVLLECKGVPGAKIYERIPIGRWAEVTHKRPSQSPFEVWMACMRVRTKKLRESYLFELQDDEKQELHTFLQNVEYESLAVVTAAWEWYKGWKRARKTQVTAVVMVLRTIDAKTKEEAQGLLLEILTGEGKTMICANTALLLVARNKQVDIMSSSSVLAEEGVEDTRKLYEIFGVTVSTNADLPEEAAKEKTAYRSNVVYGDASMFMFDELKHTYHLENTYGQIGTAQDRHLRRRLTSGQEGSFGPQVVGLIDEVDSALIDEVHKITKLSAGFSGFELLAPIYVGMWRSVQTLKLLYKTATFAGLPGNLDPQTGSTKAAKKHYLLQGRLTKIDMSLLDDEKQKELMMKRENQIKLSSIRSSELRDGRAPVDPDCYMFEYLGPEELHGFYMGSGTRPTGPRPEPEVLCHLYAQLEADIRRHGDNENEWRMAVRVEDQKCVHYRDALERSGDEGRDKLAGLLEMVTREWLGMPQHVDDETVSAETKKGEMENDKALNEDTKTVTEPESKNLVPVSDSVSESTWKPPQIPGSGEKYQRLCKDRPQMNFVTVPAFLGEFVNEQLPKWAHNALIACFDYQRDREYVVESKPTKASWDLQVKPVDSGNTGVVQDSTTWSDGLHQFIQLRESLRLQTETWTTNYLSNLAFMSRYGSQMFGLTGTLGSTKQGGEIWFLKKVYGISYARISPAQTRQNVKYPPLLIRGAKIEWKNAIIRSVIEELRRKRGVLVICPDIGTAQELAAMLEVEYLRTGIRGGKWGSGASGHAGLDSAKRQTSSQTQYIAGMCCAFDFWLLRPM